MYDVAPEHAVGLSAALATVAFAAIFVIGLRLLARRQVRWVLPYMAAYEAASPMTRLAALLMLVSGSVHLALAPGHTQGEAVTRLLFIVDGLGFTVLSLAAFVTTWWRGAAALWLTATLVAYPFWVLAGSEAPDQVGIACKLIELVALGLVLRLAPLRRYGWLRRSWRASRLPLVTAVITLGTWVGGLAHPDALHAHAGAVLQPVSAAASTEQQAAAARLLADTRASLVRFANPEIAKAAGYKPGPTSDVEPLVHFENKHNAGAILDPTRPQALVYAHTTHGLVLIGAMFQMSRIGQWGPDPGGPLTQWHQHEGICFSPVGIAVSFATPFWTCPVGAINITTAPMLHVWIIENPNGPFSADLDPKVAARLARS